MEILRQASLGVCSCKDGQDACGYCVVETVQALLKLRPVFGQSEGRSRFENNH